MVLINYFKDEVIERLRNEPDETFKDCNVTKEQILSDENVIERIWCHYQKSIEKYQVDSDYAFGDAIYEIYHVKTKGWCQL